jgi:hypothetical protein
MQESLSNYLDQIKIGGKQVYKNLALFPLLSNLAIPLEYLTLDEALAEGLVKVTEKDLGGSVPELQVVNKSPQMILILDGEELVGAKQNRIVNTTILIQAGTTLIIPVSCVEQGRWAYSASPRFMSKERIMSANLRANKAVQVHQNLKSFIGFKSEQREIWDEIEEKANRMKAKSRSMAMSHIYEVNKASLDEYTRNFKVIDGQMGAVFLIDGKVVGLDSLGKPDTFSKVFKKLLESYALDAIDRDASCKPASGAGSKEAKYNKKGSDLTGKPPSPSGGLQLYNPQKEIKVQRSQVTNFLKSTQSTQVESRPSVGLGTDLRLESRKLTGFALSQEDQILHLAVFTKVSNGKNAEPRSRMSRFSNRGGYR